MINTYDLTSESRESPPYALNTLTLERNSVLIARISRNSGYGIDELEALRKHLKEMFPYHSVFVWYDDIDFMAINDNGYKPERLDTLNDDSSNYY
jgi:hypothetical protein